MNRKIYSYTPFFHREITGKNTRCDLGSMKSDNETFQNRIYSCYQTNLQNEPGCYFRHYCHVCSVAQHDYYCFLKNKRNERVFHDIHCQTCISLGDCRNAINGELLPTMIPEFQDHLKSISNVKNPLEDFSQGYYPIVEMDSPKIMGNLISQIQDQGITSITVNPSKNMTTIQHNLLRPGTSKPLREILHFDGTIILSTNFDDKFCKAIFEDVDRFKEMIHVLEPDIITTLDANFYTDQPNFITALQLEKVFRSNDMILDLKQKMIGLVPPAMPPFFEIGLLTQLAIGHKTITVPLQEINARNTIENRRYRTRIIESLLYYQKRYDFKFMLLSTSPKERISADAWSSFSWVIKKIDGEGETAERKKKDEQTQLLKKYIQIAKENLYLKYKQKKIKNFL